MYASEVATRRGDASFRRQTTVAQPNRLVLSSNNLPRLLSKSEESEPPAVHGLRQVTHFAVLVLKQLQSLIPAAYYCEVVASSRVERYSNCNSFLIL